MLRVFVDTSVLFAEVYSATGSAREPEVAAESGLQIVTPDFVVQLVRGLPL